MNSAIFQNKMLIHKLIYFLYIYVLAYIRKTLGTDIEVQKSTFLIREAFTFSRDGITGTSFDLLPEKFFKKGQNMKQKVFKDVRHQIKEGRGS